MALELILNLFGTAERLQQMTGLLWATSPAVGLGLACVAVVLLAPGTARGVRNIHHWFDARRPSNKFRADAPKIQRLYRRWVSYEDVFTRDPEGRVLLVNDIVILFDTHEVPCPGNEDPDSLWRTFLVVTLAQSRSGDLDGARGSVDVIRSQAMEVESPGVPRRAGL